MKKLCILVIFLIITGIQLYPQRTRDVLYLKNGSVINGTIIEISGDQFKIRAIDRNIFVFKAEDVDKYVKEAPAYEGRKKGGAGIALESGFLMGPQESTYVLPFSFNCLVNYTVSTKNIFGIGTGVEFLGQAYTPFFGEYKHIILDRTTAPFVFLRGGGLMHLSKNNESTDSYQPQYNTPINRKGGFSMAIGTGISWSKEYNETYLSFAYRYARTSYKEENSQHVKTNFVNNYNRLEIKFGFKF